MMKAILEFAEIRNILVMYDAVDRDANTYYFLRQYMEDRSNANSCR